MSDRHRTKRALGRTVVGLLAALGLVAVPASATVFEGSQTDPAGDVVITPIPFVGENGQVVSGPSQVGVGSMDLSGASMSYDSGAGLLIITFSGTDFVQTHSATRFSGWISSGAHQPVGSEQCLLGGPKTDSLTFNGSSGTGSSGGPGRGGATLWIPSTPGGILDTALTGTASFPVDWPETNQVVKFTFLDARLAHHAYLCATGFLANYADHEDTNSDDIRSFCIVAGCFDPLESATRPPPPITPSTGVVTTSGSPGPTGVTAQGASTNARCSILPGKIKTTTARMRLMQRASHKGSKGHRKAVTRQVRVLASRRTTLRATYKALCT